MSDLVQTETFQPEELSSSLNFPPVTRSHILHCSYNFWYPKYRSSTIKSKIIHTSPSFVNYLRSDGIVLSNDSLEFYSSSAFENGSSLFTADDYTQQHEGCPSILFPELHQKIKDTIADLGGLVAPKLNWSAPKDATWISVKKNSMECATPDDIYLLLKSSEFITHDLEHAFSETVEEQGDFQQENIEYVLVLRKWFEISPSSEFRCFVRGRLIIGICQRDLNHFDFLFILKDQIRDTILGFFKETLKETFPESNFVFDVYLLKHFDRVRLIDINPWAPRTDPLLFSWHELLYLSVNNCSQQIMDSNTKNLEPLSDTEKYTQIENANNNIFEPEVRLVKVNDPEAINFASSKYSAQKLPREVVQAGLGGRSGITKFAAQWEKILNGKAEMQACYGSDDENHNSTCSYASF